MNTPSVLPGHIADESTLDDLLSSPSPALVEMMKRLEGDIVMLGIAGKIGFSLGAMAVRAIREAGVRKRVLGVSRFSDASGRARVEALGIEPIACDLLEPAAVAKLPRVANVIFLAGRKFGTQDSENLTWAINTVVPANVARHFGQSRIVAFSTGCVYPIVPVSSGGCTEEDVLTPIGEYSQSCLGRERVFAYYSAARKTPTCLYRLNYAIDLRYGVLHDIARRIWQGEPVDLTMGHFNVIWQGDANDIALRALEICETPATALNVTGPETVSVAYAAAVMGRFMGKPVTFSGEDSQSALLSNAAKAFRLFGYPRVPLHAMLEWTAQWVKAGGSSLNKPTHFEVKTGKY